MDQPKEFVREYRARGLYSMAELAERDVSPKTGYALVRRVEEYGVAGQQPQSRRSHTSPNRTPDHIANSLIAAKLKHPAWGPEMLLNWLKPRHRVIRHWPAVSTAGAILKRADLVQPRRKRSPRTHPGVVDSATLSRQRDGRPPIGLEKIDDGEWRIWFNGILLATFDERDYIIRR